MIGLFSIWIYDRATPPELAPGVSRSAIQTVAPEDLVVVDGDTVRLAGETIRLVGFDTPETHRALCEAERVLAHAARARLQELLDGALTVRMAYLAHRDQYGRQLAWLSLDGRNVGDTLIAEGLARRYFGGQRHSWCETPHQSDAPGAVDDR
ncbi:hypothetical protein GTA62_18360 [Roseobacter sp. HKCCD9010]|uniref:thermonuclease family protein n=1 Tax=unclassified Roseobacter TaxID=196798 RepID=UPI001490FF1B|nr:hypothetical protein [Rhodobacterales bacterium HKCCD4356]NNV13723.1 hypothetical protein [Roseobacter sp. HKCCD7357]NNV17748.1 hypothetical protein [Roseobacter sp. HKCCD8768]NNV27355.1 hypothetical protein [Roseobacter sp. HKCCD8192]NNV31475.1 hypothetical protein [Roseobacter sp. HKCCD9061]NNV35875.1 hypothetical protein [Roseobacter sp. HKCCD9073]NNV40289.1 hypothetical protein [Roseobacter sp. HKCCD9054]NNV44367.1 hypothetical protein [Roseobacter sp. HKCCD6497]NNV48822.1 hypothetic